MEAIAKTPVLFTPGAINELKRLLAEDASVKGQFLRVGVKGGGCSGLTYVLEFDEMKDGDQQFEISGISCVMNPAHEIYLYGMEVNWEGGLNSRGFTFKNPNASNTCGCGTSFSV